MSKLYCDMTGVTRPISVSITESHNSSMTIANVVAANTTLDIGDHVTIDLGYTDNHAQLFSGYVKAIEKKVPDNVYTLSLYDVMTRAIDYFMASSNPESPFSKRNILIENLVRALLQEAGLAGAGKWDDDTTHFLLGVTNPVEVNLVSVWDYCKTLADAVTWNLWADQSEVIHFKNRKPYPMELPDPGQPGWSADTSENPDLADRFQLTDATDVTFRVSEKELRNRVVVYGQTGVFAVAQTSSPYLPAGFYKSVVAAFQFIPSLALAEDSAEYNLNLFNRLTKELIVTFVGNPSLGARKVYTISEDFYDRVTGGTDYTGEKDWYAYTCEHSWSARGYTNTISLRRGITG